MSTIVLIATDQATITAVRAALPASVDLVEYERVGQAYAAGAATTATAVLLDRTATLRAAALEGLLAPRVASLTSGEPTAEDKELAKLARTTPVAVDDIAQWVAAR